MKRLALVVALLALAGCTTSHRAAPSPTSTPHLDYTAPPPTLPVPGVAVTMSTAAAPWQAPVGVDQGVHSADYVAAAGLPYGEEVTKVHYHAHLDVIIDGKAVPVPAGIGFVAKGDRVQGLSALHTHQFDGIIHIENSVPATFLLGQFFDEWGVRFTNDCVGAYCSGSGKQFAVFVNGQRQTGDVTRLVLAKHQEIAVVYGTPDQLSKAPSSHHFSNGE